MPEFDLLLGAGVADLKLLTYLAQRATRLVAVDGGANHLAETMIEPDLIIGDLDSVQSLTAWRALPAVEVQHVADQNSTDFEKAIGACDPERTKVCVGFTGGRFDQTLTVLHVLARFLDQKIIIVSEQDVIRALPAGRYQLPAYPGDPRVSLFPISETEITASRGLRYPLDPLTLGVGQRIGTSNESTEEGFAFEIMRGQCLLIQPLAVLDKWL